MQSRQLPFYIVFNKADKVSSSVARQKIEEYLPEMNIDSSVRVFCVSANNKKGTDDLRIALGEHLESNVV
jgi:GTP-binding protein EngB required for normal cell division